ncbi:MAG: methylenetetrahydrofolate--tRNA-(uracil(54)-C(5))-methyltransferase (FADH(2)-oxidizing) TrmFO, partial [Bdellovibrionales bacterium]|nr:methylenetetrahydrofolate--tRNA-(uracil(54)-C(5))-methyltransferase (FADH(2)-oxidizing) TrmFO [Bdellovibrionales bacterium]
MGQVTIVGGGLAGSEAAWQLVRRGIRVRLLEMRPQVGTKAHKTGRFAELVCSNSFRGRDLSNAVGLLKEELKLLDSLVMHAALASEVPAGGALAVDRDVFSSIIDDTLRSHPLVEVVTGEVDSIPASDAEHPVIIATGPLTSKTLSRAIEELTGSESLAFFDAISPIILGESIDQDIVFRRSRYDKGDGDDYLNIPLDREQYYQFVESVRAAEKFGGHEEVEADMVDNLRPFEGCMPIEEMIDRGPDTLLFGPFK